MKILIYIYYEHKTNSLKMFKADVKFWLDPRTTENIIMFSHHLKLYAKNFDCPHNKLKKLISMAKKMKKGDERTITLL